MTMTQIPATSSAPTLRERAQAEYDDVQFAQARREAEKGQERAEQCRTQIVAKFAEVLGVRDGVVIREVVVPFEGYDIVEYVGDVEGLTFSVRELSGSESYRDRTRLHVQRDCINCGQPVWVELGSLYDLHQALTTPQMHMWSCVAREPTPPRLTPEESARQAVDGIDGAASDLVAWMFEEEQAIRHRDGWLRANVERLIHAGAVNDLTKKPHSVASATEELCATGDYAELQRLRVEAEHERVMAEARYEQAKLRAALAVKVAQ